MFTFLGRRAGVLAVSLCLAVVPIMQPANAAIISTQDAINLAERQDRIERISEVLAEDSVHNMMVRLGVDPNAANARVAALTDAELLTLEQQLNELPAGGAGVVEVVGIVAIVLLILELLNVTNFFSEF